MLGRFLKQLFSRKQVSTRRVFNIANEDEWGSVGELPFENVEKLNPMQACFKENYNPDNNCLVTSKTSTGKTLDAFIAGTCCLNVGKHSVLTAPTRELVNELYALAVGIFGRQVVGRYNGTDKSVEGKFMVVTTPEGYLSGLRGNREWAKGASLLIVDEAHNLAHPSRGRSLDAAITMFRRMGGKLLLMSATFPDAEEVSRHLDADLFISNYERTKIERIEIHAPDDLEAMTMPKKLMPDMVATESGYAYNKKSLRLQKLRELLFQENGASSIIFVPTKAQGFCLSAELNIPFHCKDVCEEDKRAIIAGFRTGTIKTLIATETLSQGVNTPADTTIVFGGRRGGYYLDSSDITQKEGRGGRNKDTSRSYLIGDKAELFHMKAELYTKTLPLPTEELLLTMLCMKNCTREEMADVVLSTYAATLIDKQKVVEAVNRYVNFLNACNILKEKNGEYRLTEEGALLARFFIPPSAYMGYVKLAKKLREAEMTDVEKGCILLSTLFQSLPHQGCPARLEKDFQMRLIKMELDKELSASKAGILRHYLDRPSAIPEFLSGAIMGVERWLAMLSDMERYKIREESPGKRWIEGLVVNLKANILKKMAKKKPCPPSVQLSLVERGTGKEEAHAHN